MTGGKPFQSKLNPHVELIRGLRQQRIPYPEIARILREKHGLAVGPTTIFDFVKVRSKKRDVYTIPEDRSAVPSAKSTPEKPPAPPPPAVTRPIRENRRAKLPATKKAVTVRRQTAGQSAVSQPAAGQPTVSQPAAPAKSPRNSGASARKPRRHSHPTH